LCQSFGETNDRQNLVLARGPTSAVVMNRYPYTAGHLMICPYRHTSTLADLTSEEMLECMRWSSVSIELLKKHIKPEGFNIGINLGDAGGAGLKDHLHIHVVPRWIGDTNFTGVVGDVRVLPQALDAMWDELHPSFAAISIRDA
jgi:ATP adenylyltransferase